VHDRHGVLGVGAPFRIEEKQVGFVVGYSYLLDVFNNHAAGGRKSAKDPVQADKDKESD